MTEYQNRVDIDNLYDLIYDYDTKSLKLVSFKNKSPLALIGETQEDRGTLDAIFDYLDLTTLANDGITPILNLYSKPEVDALVSSMCTKSEIDNWSTSTQTVSGLKLRLRYNPTLRMCQAYFSGADIEFSTETISLSYGLIASNCPPPIRTVVSCDHLDMYGHLTTAGILELTSGTTGTFNVKAGAMWTY